MMADATPTTESTGTDRVPFERWPSEIPLLILVALASAAIWMLLLVTVVGAIYGLMIGLVLFFSALSAVVVVFLGILRASGGGYEPEILNEHRRFGIAVGAVTV